MNSRRKCIYFLAWTLLISVTFVSMDIENPCSVMYPQGPGIDWKEGIIYIDFCSSLDVYADVDLEEVIGRLGRNEHGRVEFFKKAMSGFELPAHYENVIEIIHSGYLYVPASRIEDGVFEVVVGNMDYRIAGYVSSPTAFRTCKEILAANFHLGGWNSGLLVKNLGYTMGVNLFQNCLNIRVAPSLDSTVITCVLDNLSATDHWHDFKIVTMKGKWGYVEIIKYQYSDEEISGEGEIDCETEVDSFSGWAKIIDDDGTPNLWFSSSAY